jgi:hypothetical protein
MVQSQGEGLINPGRRSIFREVLDDEDQPMPVSKLREKPTRPALKVRFKSKASIIDGEMTGESEWEDVEDEENAMEPSAEIKTPAIHITPVRSRISRKMYRLGVLFMLFAISIPVIQRFPLFGAPGRTPLGANAGAVRAEMIHRRQDTNTDVCKRWSQQSAIINGTMYLYGGRSTTSAQQTSDTWSTYRALDHWLT